ncbi:unnamed protein product [Brugia timori]|uniref:Uncharacterized protein n=1 Tax=Brugia timori TaxID=42155 RepID=A0A0R3Q3K6_9BILA|nr:unnamed protein product [Brugia timori]
MDIEITAQCRSQKLETSDDIVDDTKEVNNSISSNSSLTAVQQPVDKAATLVATPVSLSRDSSENIEGSSKSVHGIVASLIRAAEETHFQTPDKPNSLNVSNKKFQQEQPSITTTTTTASGRQEIGTQTSPYSLSRSSSFDWINESSIEDQYSEELVTASTESPGTPEDPEYSLLNRITEPSRITDREIQGMLRKSMEARNSLLEEKKTQSSEDIDESIAMLLEYAEDLNVVSNRVLHYPVISENLTKHANDIRNNDSVLSVEISSDISRNRMPSTNNQNGLHHL